MGPVRQLIEFVRNELGLSSLPGSPVYDVDLPSSLPMEQIIGEVWVFIDDLRKGREVTVHHTLQLPSKSVLHN